MHFNVETEFLNSYSNPIELILFRIFKARRLVILEKVLLGYTKNKL